MTRIKKGIVNIQLLLASLSLLLIPAACSVNPATGEQQFTMFMSPQQEARIGAVEHEKIMQLFGGPVKDEKLQKYVDSIGRKLVPVTERQDVDYKFYVLDTPIVNAFALPGGYVYVSRGLVSLANSEAELASVVGHEIGHITGRHSAERYSQSVLASLGTAVLSTAVDKPGATDIARLGSQLYISSYSRDQETEADKLGIRYISRAGYEESAASSFLASLYRHSELQKKLRGNQGRGGFDFFATHPKTENRVAKAQELARAKNTPTGVINRDRHLDAIDGMIYGHSPSQGFVQGQSFIHPEMGFRFDVPAGFEIINNPSEVIAVSDRKGIIIFDSDTDKHGVDVTTYLTRIWMKGEMLQDVETITVNGMRAATGVFPGRVKNRNVNIRVVAVRWGPDRYFRFMMAIPRDAGPDLLDEYKRTTYSLQRLSGQDMQTFKPRRIEIFTARPGDTVASLAAQQAFEKFPEQHFRIINGLDEGERIVPGQRYKRVVRK